MSAGSRSQSRDEKPRLLIDNSDPHRTVIALRDILAEAGGLYDRGAPVRLAFDQMQKGVVAQVMTPDALVLTTHAVSRPYIVKPKKDAPDEVDVRLPRYLAVMYLDWRGEWRLPPLNGIATAPLLRDGGSFNSFEGYNSASGMWCENMPNLEGLVPDQPTQNHAASALRLIRDSFKVPLLGSVNPSPLGDRDATLRACKMRSPGVTRFGTASITSWG